jgi:uncharacterized protein (TIGR03083 family)
MVPLLPDGELRELTAAQIDLFTSVVTGLSDADLVAPTGCDGWLVAHLLLHVRFGAAEMLAGFADLVELPAERDYVNYWRDWAPTGVPATFNRVRWHWAQAASYSDGDALRQHFADTARAAAAISRTARPGNYRTLGHVMASGDVLAIWVVEYVLHHMDLIAHLPGKPGPLPEAVRLVTATLDGLLGGPRPPSWDEPTYARKGSGRALLDEADLAFLGDRAKAYPAFA